MNAPFICDYLSIISFCFLFLTFSLRFLCVVLCPRQIIPEPIFLSFVDARLFVLIEIVLLSFVILFSFFEVVGIMVLTFLLSGQCCDLLFLLLFLFLFHLPITKMVKISHMFCFIKMLVTKLDLWPCLKLWLLTLYCICS